MRKLQDERRQMMKDVEGELNHYCLQRRNSLVDLRPIMTCMEKRRYDQSLRLLIVVPASSLKCPGRQH